MDVEIRTTTDTWIARVDPADLGEEPVPGAAAVHVRDQIQSKQAVEARPVEDRTSYLVAFNPGQIICVVESRRGFRPNRPGTGW